MGRRPKPSGPQRWSVQRKTDAVLRVLGGESPEAVAGELGIAVEELATWQEAFVQGGQERLKVRPGDPLQRELEQALNRIEQLTMELELYERRCTHTDWLEIVRAMVGKRSPATGKPYPVTMLCRVFDVPRASLYAAQKSSDPRPAALSDEEIVGSLRQHLRSSRRHRSARDLRQALTEHGIEIDEDRFVRLVGEARARELDERESEAGS